ncbi:CerR family C-terminal domain-containing protein [uncultured Marinobacter sp.]|jgi:AcrR family transcriptional regulator|uniref:CerR family C-terminal domain-containing protein n=1 Tax=uncultured Marinobacter sp. TaxID=187379 RepID=UPI000C090521|nr:hypothetical protein [Marinobacter sp.]MBI44459.1 hypothetical protein [Oceanospirillales bacterium]|tara:strand:+ start:3819 stop:4475 length:657 start_codon:yes stop_codon:yes gene_type:complete
MSKDSRKRQGDHTRDALLKAATRVFAQAGYHGASTRAIAQAANVNQALIGYHFGSKEALYQAVFVSITEALEQRMAARVDTLEAMLAAPEVPRPSYLAVLEGVCGGMAELMVQPETEYWSQLILREQQQPGPAFEALYERFMGRVLDTLTRVVAHLCPALDRRDVKLLVVSMIGQVIVWRFARAGIQRHLGWQQPDIEAIKNRLFTNIRLLLQEDPAR